MKPSEIAREHFDAAIREAEKLGFAPENIARYMLSLIITKYLETRSVSDVRSELIGAAENCDPNTDYVFMRP